MSFLKHLLPAWKRGIEDKRRANAAILAAVDRELKDSEAEAIKGKLLMALDTSSGEWLDQYGRIFGLLRRDNEEDDAYRSRIISYVKLRRGTIPAIKAAIQDFLQDYDSYIEIYEPYKNVFTLNKSKLNGADHLLGKYYTVAVIDIKISRPFPIGLVDVINEFKPAGVSFRLTYRPSSHNPNAALVELPPANSVISPSITNLTIANGITDRIKGHLNLTASSRTGDSSGLFTLNRSKLNSLDRLAGSLSAANANYNLATYSNQDLTFSDSTKIEDVMNSSDTVSPDFYTKTGRVDNQYAVQTIYTGSDSFLYFTMDVATYLKLKYNKYLRRVAPDGVYTKETYAQLMDGSYIQYNLSAVLSSGVNYTVQAFSLSDGEWLDLHSTSAGIRYINNIVSINNVVEHLSDNGLMFIRFKFLAADQDAEQVTYQAPDFTGTEYELVLDGGNFTDVESEEVISGNYENSGEAYDIRLDFFELGFSKIMPRDFSEPEFIKEISGVSTITDKSVTYTTYSGIESSGEAYEFVLDGGTPEDHTYTETIDGNYKEF
ncbi:baseplate protein [Phage f2b1]|nr:baseplate protein [Phage f2b1]